MGMILARLMMYPIALILIGSAGALMVEACRAEARGRRAGMIGAAVLCAIAGFVAFGMIQPRA